MVLQEEVPMYIDTGVKGLHGLIVYIRSMHAADTQKPAHPPQTCPIHLVGDAVVSGNGNPPPFTFSCFNSNTWGKVVHLGIAQPSPKRRDRIASSSTGLEPILALTCSQILRKRRHLKPSPSEPAERLGKIGQQQQQDPQRDDEHRVTYYTCVRERALRDSCLGY